MIRLMLYSPDIKLQSLLASALKSEYQVVLESRKERLKEAARESGADILVLDFDSNYSSLEQQLEFYTQLGESQIPTVVMTDDLRRSTAMEFMRRGAHDCIRKPPSLVEFKVIVGRAYEHALMKKELESIRLTMGLTHGCDRLVGSSGRAQVVYDLIRRVADLSASVLITGESGTGKELVARAIHNAGDRASKPFVAVSCAALAETLLESELFGHEKGSFTGANQQKRGKFEMAGAGTIFLDEIGDISPKLQVDLLRVLQNRSFYRVGGSEEVRVDVRVVAATHVNLQQAVADGNFRDDLYYRLNVIEIRIPPLRARREDIPLLARHFVERLSHELGKDVSEVGEGALRLLLDHNWPGNVRELENAVERAMVTCRGPVLTESDFGFLAQTAAPATAWAVPAGMTMQDMEKVLIAATIERTQGNIKEAASVLGIDRSTLYEKIKKYEIQR